MSRRSISDASIAVDISALDRPTLRRADAIAAIEAWRSEIRAACRRNVEAAEDTEERAATSGAQAEAVLDAHRSGPHAIEIGPCPHARPGDPRCDACLAVAARKDL